MSEVYVAKVDELDDRERRIVVEDGLEIGESRISATDLAGLITRIHDNTISGKIAKQVFEAMWGGEGTADEIIEAKGLKQITDSSAIEVVVDKVIEANPGQVAEYKAGKEKLIGFFVGQVMKETKGQANPGQVAVCLGGMKFGRGRSGL